MYIVTKEMQAETKKKGITIPGNLLTMNGDAKTVKGHKKGYLTGIMYMKPNHKICPSSKVAECDKVCLFGAGRGQMHSTQNHRENKTLLFQNFEQYFMIALHSSIRRLLSRAKRMNLTPCVRLNGTSDIDWSSKLLDGKTIFEHFPDLQFYDYTKVPSNVRKARQFPNYHVTISFSSAYGFGKLLTQMMPYGNNIAVVFRGPLPKTFLGLPVIKGDETDLRFLDNDVILDRVVVGLTAKGKARKDDIFVVDSNLIAIAA